MVTPHESHHNLAQALGISEVIFKREDLHPYGSHKGRSIPIMIDKKISQGFNHFAISSSGNAALAAGLYIKKLNNEKDNEKTDKNKITLEIIAGKNINPNKLKKLEDLRDSNILLSLQDRPLQALFMKTQDSSIQSLRQSNDDTALLGYKALAQELLEIKNLKAIFIGTSSGTTAQALAEFFNNKENSRNNVEMYIVQTTSCHPMSDKFIENETATDKVNEKSIADAIVDTVALRKDFLIPLIEKSGGNSYIATNEEIKAAQDLVNKQAGLTISPNSALSVAGLMQASYTGRTWEGPVVCMICGD